LAVILEAKNVSIRYVIGNYKDIGFKDYVIQKLRGEYKLQEFWAVKNVSFQISDGDFLGIIGKNGAGKSTLLKAVSGIIRPTRGSLSAKKSVTALLELGVGFDGDMTVRENIFLRGAILGYTRAFMNAAYDGIIEFSELQEFVDRPLKQLSSGMKGRLAFSIACLVKPEILILDEVLAAGDASFRKKSEAKMTEILNSGVSTIFVSHSLGSIKKLCNKVLWMHKGEQMAFGETEEICNMYTQFIEDGN